ncbi:hypothetical protein D0Z08_17025 [Nocardioides immobilis]|uniref:Peptidase S8/S53 domain-containing protein n=1 Tax=Nocardioides immobilis TaxID=2049295 RepID=A0A417Y091_9ACTN|nr:S8 family serine peptidase [Nocardioides immobilis]RHW26025.1 hypothetical protein D0Z08_17025 [Nocardioides immobilis]
MTESPRPTFSLRDLFERIRFRLPWSPIKPPIAKPDPPRVDAERLRSQVAVVRRAFRENGDVGVAAPDGPYLAKDDADANFLFRPGIALVRDNTDDQRYFDEFVDFFTRRDDLFGGRAPVRREDVRLPDGLVMVDMPSRSDEADSVLVTLDEIDKERRAQFGDRERSNEDDEEEDKEPPVLAQPDHVLYVTGPVGNLCPAIEPERPRETGPWPPVNPDGQVGDGVRVSVVDTGWWTAAASHPTTKQWVSDVYADKEDEEHLNGTEIHEYAGHGTFVAGVIKCLAPAARVEVEGVLTHGGAVSESEICEQLNEAINENDLPQLISISAGSRTLNNNGLLGLEILLATKGVIKNVNTLVVAAAGNDGDDEKFYPAAYPWVVGVGSVDPDRKRSKFSNFGKWVKVYARGRDLVNAFPVGTYTCHYPENKNPQTQSGTPEVRQFDGLARWSGTSFAAPMVTGAIAAHMSATGNTTHPWRAYNELTTAAAAAGPGPDGKPIIGPL